MNITNQLGLPEAIYNAVTNHESGKTAQRDINRISVTQIITPPQIIELRYQHWDEITEDCADMLWALMGTAMHVLLEQAHDSAIQEGKLTMQREGFTVVGIFDRLHADSGVLQDYKFASVWEWIYGLKEDRIAQLNILAELARVNGYEVKKLEVVFLFRDWSKTKARHDKQYPPHQLMIVPVPMWTQEQVDTYLTARLEAHRAAREGDIRWCTADERWAKPTVYAVMKTGRKSAIRLFDNLDDATDLASQVGGFVTIRKGENTRCENYCLVKEFCQQFKHLKENE